MNADYLASLLREDLATDTSWQCTGENFRQKPDGGRVPAANNWSEKLCMYSGDNGFGDSGGCTTMEAGCCGDASKKKDGGWKPSLTTDIEVDWAVGLLPMYAAGAFAEPNTATDCYSGEVPHPVEPPLGSSAAAPESLRNCGASISGGSGYTTTTRTARTSHRLRSHLGGSSYDFDAAFPDVLRQIQARYLPTRTFSGLLGVEAAGGTNSTGSNSSPTLPNPIAEPVAPTPEFSLPGHFWLLARSLYLLRKFHCWSCSGNPKDPATSSTSGQPPPPTPTGEDLGGNSTRKRPGILSLRLRRRTLERTTSSATGEDLSEFPAPASSATATEPELLGKPAARGGGGEHWELPTEPDDINAFEKSVETLEWSSFDASSLFRSSGSGGGRHSDASWRGRESVASVSEASASGGGAESTGYTTGLSSCSEISVAQATWVALLFVYALQRQESRRRSSKHPEMDIPLSSTLTTLASALAVQNRLNQVTGGVGRTRAIETTKGSLRSVLSPAAAGGGMSSSCRCSTQPGMSIVCPPRGRLRKEVVAEARITETTSPAIRLEMAPGSKWVPLKQEMASSPSPPINHRVCSGGGGGGGVSQAKQYWRPMSSSSEAGGSELLTNGQRAATRPQTTDIKCDQGEDAEPAQQFRRQKPAIFQVCSKILADVKSNKSLFPLGGRFVGSPTTAPPIIHNSVDPAVNHRLLKGIWIYVKDCVTVLEIIQDFCVSLFVGSAWTDEQDPLSTTTLSDFLDTAYQVLESFKPCRSTSSARLLLATSEKAPPKNSASVRPQQQMGVDAEENNIGVRSQLKRLAAATASSIYLTVTPSCLQAHGILESVIESHRASPGCIVCRDGSDSSSRYGSGRHPSDAKRDRSSRFGLGRRDFQKNLFTMISSIGYSTRITGSTLALSGHLLIQTISLYGQKGRLPSGSIASLSTIAIPPSTDGYSDTSTYPFSEQTIYV